MRKKVNETLLTEELKKFKKLYEYNFYREDSEKDKDIILGSIDEENPEGDNNSDPVDDITNDLGIGDVKDTEPKADDLGGDEESGEMTADIPKMPEIPEEPEMVEPPEEPKDDEVEIDITSLVKSTNKARKTAKVASKNTEMLLKKMSALEDSLTKMMGISDKIEAMEKEIIKRNPTPVEKLEMRSLSSFPFSQKLTDYWDNHEGNYDVGVKKDDYVLTKGDVDSEYNYVNAKQSLSAMPENYEEEDISGYSEEDI